MSHSPKRRLHRRQGVELGFDAPTGIAGIEGTTVINGVAAGTGLAIDSAAAGQPPVETSAPEVSGLVGLDSIVFQPTASEPAPTSSESVVSPGASAASSSISVATVVAACVGAFLGAGLIILLGVCLYRRSIRTARKPSSRSPAWNKLPEANDDKWEARHDPAHQQTKQVAPLEEMSMFKGSSSIKSEKTSDHGHLDFSNTPFAVYHPKLAEDMAALPSPRPFAGRVATVDPAVSWGGETLQDDNASYLNIRPSHLSTGQMSPIALPTPAIVSSQLHRWESAEVLHFDSTDESNNPFADKPPRRSLTSPYFGGSQETITRLPKGQSRRRSSRSQSRERTPKRKQSQSSQLRNPFADEHAEEVDYGMPIPRPFVHEQTHNSSVSAGSSQAMASLIAALDTKPEDDEQQRLRVHSMQPSFVSAQSEYVYDDRSEVRPPTSSQHVSMQPSFVSSVYPEEDIAAFPLPPTTTTTTTSLR